MVTNLNITLAVPLYMKSIDTQIRELGGKGFNVNVTSQRVAGSFSRIYSFETDDGVKSLLTRNEFQVGVIDGCFIICEADNSRYMRVERKRITKPPYMLHLSAPLGYSFDAMREKLQEIYPTRQHWDLKNPADYIDA